MHNVQSAQWREALKILKLCVTRSSTLAAPPPSTRRETMSSSYTSSFMHDSPISAHTSFAEADISFKKELPGKGEYLILKCKNLTSVV